MQLKQPPQFFQLVPLLFGQATNLLVMPQMIYSKLHLNLSHPQFSNKGNALCQHCLAIRISILGSSARTCEQNSLMEANDARSRSLKCTFSFLLKLLISPFSACSPLSTFLQAIITFAFFLARSTAVSFPIPCSVGACDDHCLSIGSIVHLNNKLLH